MEFEKDKYMPNQKIKMRPVLDGDFWMIGDNPDLGAINGNTDPAKGAVQECVDHHIYMAGDGKWHLWGCIRGTRVGRILYHWKAGKLTDAHWEQTGDIMRSDQSAGEDMCRLFGQEWIQSPFVVKDGGVYYMFYGGHTTEWDAFGRASDHIAENDFRINSSIRGQICAMTSRDGLNWERRLNVRGQTRLFMGPGQTRDPMVMKSGGIWYMYTAGAAIDYDGRLLPQVYVRFSTDLLNWSDYSVAHYDFSANLPGSRDRIVWTHECPFVIERAGYFYLLRTEDYAGRRTHVYRSEDPCDFGLGDEEARAKYVGLLPVGAPEIIRDSDGTEYITSNHNLTGGTMMCRLGWADSDE